MIVRFTSYDYEKYIEDDYDWRDTETYIYVNMSEIPAFYQVDEQFMVINIMGAEYLIDCQVSRFIQYLGTPMVYEANNITAN